MINLDERSPDPLRRESLRMQQASNRMRVSIPGIVQSYDTAQQTVTVQVAIREKLNIDGNESWADIPLLLDVPVVFPRAGGYVLTLPIKKGDEVLVMFGDCCIDAWWQSGGVQNQVEWRRHDLSDAFAIPGPFSRPRLASPIPADALELTAPGVTLRLEPGRLIIKGPVYIEGSARLTGHITENTEEEEE